MAKKSRRRKKKSHFSKFFLSGLVCLLFFYLVMTYLVQPLKVQLLKGDNQQAYFIERIAPHAQKIQKREGLLASISIGQAILESDWGMSALSQENNNLFGIKAFGNEPKVTMYTKEYFDNQWVDIPADFRSYKSWEESLDDHVNLFKVGVNWNQNLYQKVLEARDYKEAAFALQEAGYATDPNYDQKIISVIESYRLDKFDH